MKNTKYFDSVQDVNNYYPDGVPSNVIAIVGDGSNVFISSDNAISGNQQYYSADMTNDEIVAEQVQAAEQQGYDTGYTAGETAGYDTGYAAGEAAAGTNWLDVLYLDEKAKAESFLGISDWGLNDFYKYNFAKYATSEPYIDQQVALSFILGLQNDDTMFKLIKITKDADGNAIITNNPCSINYDGTNNGAIALDGVTYYNKICIWGTLTLAAGDEVIMICANKFEDIGSHDIFATGLFGGFDDETNDPATYKCETAGTYTFGIWVDKLDVQDGQAACFVSTMFNYEGSATVPAITVPTGETSGGSTSLTTEQINNMSFGFVMNEIIDTGAQYARLEMCDIDVIEPYVVSQMFYSTGIHFVVDKYNDTTGLTADYDWVYAADDTVTPQFISATVSLNAGDEVGFTLAPAVDDGMGGYAFEDSCLWLQRYVDPENTGNGYNTHFFHVDNTGDYEFKITIGTDPESGDDVASWTFTQVVQP